MSTQRALRCSGPRVSREHSNTFNSCLSLVKKFHTTYGTPSRNLGTQHIFFRAGIGCFSMDCGPFESVPVRDEQQCSYLPTSDTARKQPDQCIRSIRSIN